MKHDNKSKAEAPKGGTSPSFGTVHSHHWNKLLQYFTSTYRMGTQGLEDQKTDTGSSASSSTNKPGGLLSHLLTMENIFWQKIQT